MSVWHESIYYRNIFLCSKALWSSVRLLTHSAMSPPTDHFNTTEWTFHALWLYCFYCFYFLLYYTFSGKYSSPSSLNLICHSNTWPLIDSLFLAGSYIRPTVSMGDGMYWELHCCFSRSDELHRLYHLFPCRRAEEHSVFVKELFLTLANIVLFAEWLIGSSISILRPCRPICAVACSWNHLVFSCIVYCEEVFFFWYSAKPQRQHRWSNYSF